MSKVILQGHIIASAQDLPEIEIALPTHIELTRQESGCIVFEVSRDTENNNRFNVYEEFTDEKAFEAHQVRAKASHWGRVSANVIRHYQIKKGV